MPAQFKAFARGVMPAVLFVAAGAAVGGAAEITTHDAEQIRLAETLVEKGRLEDGIVACVACHRSGGEGDAGSEFGNLTGLSKEYHSKALKDYQSGVRENRVMEVVAKNLTESDIEALTLYYSRLKPGTAPSKIPEAPAIGVSLAEQGDANRGIPPCTSCHGAEALRSDKTLPLLDGQHPGYLRSQLAAWQSGERRNDPGSIMAGIAKKLSPAEIDAVAVYFARLPRGAH